MKLEFDSIEYSYDERPLLSGIYITTTIGQVTGLLGRNGTGKSTLLRIVFGSLPCEVRSVRIDGEFIKSPAFTSRKIVYLPQAPFIPTGITLQNILTLYNIAPATIFRNFPELLEDLSLTTTELSGGRRRLFEVLLVLNMPAPFCLLDEPFTGLSPAITERLITEIRQKKQIKGIIITDHLYRKVFTVSDQLYVLSNGRTFPIATPHDLARHGYLSAAE